MNAGCVDHLVPKTLLSDARWAGYESVAQPRVAATRVNLLLWNRKVDTVKAFVLIGAVVFQIAALVFVSLAVYEDSPGSPAA